MVVDMCTIPRYEQPVIDLIFAEGQTKSRETKVKKRIPS